MKNLIIILILFFLLFGCEKESEEYAPNFIKGKFVSTIDGNVCTWNLNGTYPRQITEDAKWENPPSGFEYYETYYETPLWSFDGSQIISVKNSRVNGNSIWIMDNNGDNKEKVLQLNEPILAMDWSNDNKWIAYSTISDESIYIVSLDGQEHKIINEIDEYKIRYISWSPDSKKIICCTTMSAVFIVDVTTEEIHNLSPIVRLNSKPCWSPNGQFVAYSYSHHPMTGCIVILNVGANSIKVVKEEYQSIFSMFDWTPDGQYIIYKAHTESISLEAMKLSTGSIIDLRYKKKNDSYNTPSGDIFIFN